MAKVWIYFLIQLWILYLVSSGIYLFSRGFLLSRSVHTTRSECTRLKLCEPEVNEAHCLHSAKIHEILANANSSSEYCLPQKTRVILLVIDALKYEFGVFNKSNHHPLPFQNRLPVFEQLLTQQPNRTRLLKFIADAPTTTLQRLKGITTGSFPTFIDVGSNFATPEINEDNIIDQIKNNNLSAVMLGDSTWTDLFPKRFVREYSFPSFDIFDLDTVDQGINENLSNELAKDDWSLLVAHYLGVDHCGHKHGPMHPEMIRKLTEMNTVIEKIVKKMDEKTTLFVIGDHGMTGTGDHGGDSEDEVTSLLFAYNKRYDFITDTKNDSMDQIDLVPSMAAILGVPIPSSNLGSTNFDIVPDVPIPELSKSHVQMLHSWQNAKQIRYFLGNYSSQNQDTFTAQMLHDFFSQFYIFSLRMTSLYTARALENFSNDVKLYLQDLVVKCRMVWVQFDPNQMSQGLLFTAVVIVFLYLLITNLKFQQIEVIFTYANLLFIYASNICLGLITYAAHIMLGWNGALQGALVYTCVYSIALLAFLLIQNWDFIALNWSQQKHFSNLFTRTVFVFSVAVFYSNSFVIQEQKILCYLICGALITLLYKIRNQYVRLATWRRVRPELILNAVFFKLAVATLMAILLLRASYSFHKCREEHGNCTSFEAGASHLQGINAKVTSISGIDWRNLLPILMAALFVTFSRELLRKCGNLSGFTSHVLLARYGPTVAAFACTGHFFLTLMKYTKFSSSIPQVRIDAMAWIVYVIFALHVGVLISRPLMLFVLEKSKPSFSVSLFGQVIPQIVRRMREMYEDAANDRRDGEDSDVPVVYGLATVYSSVLWSTAIVFVFLLIILLGPLAANGVFIIIFTGSLVLILNAILRYQQSPRLEFCLQPEFISLVIWQILAHYSFYATSHQTTLSQIDWHAAFVGRTAVHDHNIVISAILVLINTFGGHFLVFGLYPLLVMTPAALFTIYPSLVPQRISKIIIKNNNGTKQREIVKKIFDNPKSGTSDVTAQKHIDDNDDLDISHGELTLYENDDLFIGCLFKTGCQLIILQGVRIFSAMLACTIQCRHLMVWKIFAPRFIYEGIATYIIFGAILIGFLIVIRVHNAVNRLMITISDTRK